MHLDRPTPATSNPISPRLPACLLSPGQVLWEVYTGGHVFKGVPRALLGHQVTTAHKRPEWPPGTPSGYSSLAASCWDATAAKR
jgi:hypothetical protein